ncbi:hypothetical protein NMY22_g18509 [Coprinellus aureogranulatus]|nr:hypothetical protein NMY22_g18509 [Coprinellus aureogranulatus]
MRIKHSHGKIYLDQTSYLEKIVLRFGMQNAKAARTPMPEGYKPMVNEKPLNPELRALFLSLIGSLLYLMLGTRPDIAYAVTRLAQFSANPSQEHVDKAKYIFWYLVGTKNYALVYNGPGEQGLIGFTDSDYAEDPNFRRSITGNIVMLAGCAISWRSRGQKTVAQSSTEAEYMALAELARQVMWVKRLFGEMGIHLTATPVCSDNQGAIFDASNAVQEKRIKHIDVRYHYIRECVEDGNLEVLFVPGSDNVADLFTKALGWVKFERLRKMTGLVIYSSKNA